MRNLRRCGEELLDDSRLLRIKIEHLTANVPRRVEMDTQPLRKTARQPS